MSIDQIKNPIIAETPRQREVELLSRIFNLKLLALEKNLLDPKISPEKYWDMISGMGEIAQIAGLYSERENQRNPDISEMDFNNFKNKIRDEIGVEIREVAGQFIGEQRASQIASIFKKHLEEFPE